MAIRRSNTPMQVTRGPAKKKPVRMKSGGKPGQWSARKAQMLAKEYKAKGGGYRS